MKFMRLFKASLLTASFLFLLGCAGQEAAQTDPGVEDLNPGEKSVIDSPSRQIDNQSSIKEKNI